VEFSGRCLGESFPCFNQQFSLATGQQAFQFDGRLHELFNAFWPEAKPSVPVAVSANDEFFNHGQHGGFNFEPFGRELGTQTPPIADPTGSNCGDNPLQSKHNIVLKIIAWWGWELSNHLWLWPLSWILASLIGFLISKIQFRRRFFKP